MNQAKYVEADSLLQRALAIEERVYGPDHLHVAATLDELAAVRRQAGRAGEADALDARAKAIRDGVGPDQ